MRMLLAASIMAIGMLAVASPASAATTNTDTNTPATTTHKVVHRHHTGATVGLHSGAERHQLTTGHSKNGAGQEPGNQVIQDRDQRRDN